MEEGPKADAAAFGFPAPVGPGATRVGWIGIGVMGGAMAKHLLAAGFAVTAYARTPAKAESLLAAASDVMMFTMVGNPSDIRAVVLDPATGALACLRPGGLLVDWTSSSPFLSREIAAAAPPQCAMLCRLASTLTNVVEVKKSVEVAKVDEVETCFFRVVDVVEVIIPSLV
uniref:6-phosphogluconate dehydrogenase NADP-binding domain-containing protein n=1 Tax=Setaria italica TaxID=4555 RepID=K3ZCP0_SETIT